MTTPNEPKPLLPSERLAAALGRPRSRHLTEEEKAILEEKIRRAEEELEQIYGTDERDAA